MKSNSFNTLLHTCEFEDTGWGDYRLYNDDNEDFFFNFTMPEGEITFEGEFKVTEEELFRVHEVIDEFIDEHLYNVHDDRWLSDDLEEGLFHYGY
jgi:hypothetical protein